MYTFTNRYVHKQIYTYIYIYIYTCKYVYIYIYLKKTRYVHTYSITYARYAACTLDICRISIHHLLARHVPPGLDPKMAKSLNQNCDSFVVVRDPMERMRSEFNWLRKLSFRGLTGKSRKLPGFSRYKAFL